MSYCAAGRCRCCRHAHLEAAVHCACARAGTGGRAARDRVKRVMPHLIFGQASTSCTLANAIRGCGASRHSPTSGEPLLPIVASAGESIGACCTRLRSHATAAAPYLPEKRLVDGHLRVYSGAVECEFRRFRAHRASGTSKTRICDAALGDNKVPAMRLTDGPRRCRSGTAARQARRSLASGSGEGLLETGALFLLFDDVVATVRAGIDPTEPHAVG